MENEEIIKRLKILNKEVKYVGYSVALVSAIVKIKENETLRDIIKEQKEVIKEQEDSYNRMFGLWHNRELIKKFDDDYDEMDKLKNPNRDYIYRAPDAEEVYKRYYKLIEIIDKTKNNIKEKIQKSFNYDYGLENSDYRDRLSSETISILENVLESLDISEVLENGK